MHTVMIAVNGNGFCASDRPLHIIPQVEIIDVSQSVAEATKWLQIHFKRLKILKEVTFSFVALTSIAE